MDYLNRRVSRRVVRLCGCFLVLRRMAMLGDAISHAVLPGIAIAFLVTKSRQSIFMLIGATVLGLVTAFLVQALIAEAGACAAMRPSA